NPGNPASVNTASGAIEAVYGGGPHVLSLDAVAAQDLSENSYSVSAQVWVGQPGASGGPPDSQYVIGLGPSVGTTSYYAQLTFIQDQVALAAYEDNTLIESISGTLEETMVQRDRYYWLNVTF